MAAKQNALCLYLCAYGVSSASLHSAPCDQIVDIYCQLAAKRQALHLLREPWHKCDIQQTRSLWLSASPLSLLSKLKDTTQNKAPLIIWYLLHILTGSSAEASLLFSNGWAEDNLSIKTPREGWENTVGLQQQTGAGSALRAVLNILLGFMLLMHAACSFPKVLTCLCLHLPN